ncbi:hypothetical protein [Halobiforma nitratireducens]|uniref:DUF1102 domain-containing protein n=1 Tax=Halobiforma nitratireducens JCM 10879 TaxID=1227454 RepID=M0LIW2_9EURY|nr:hypothetical protein [Halobiforma nitratireducens]EMA32374.1 hypothetical protein C446_14719 [Halobiforma nitratireducens JCM 10879]
MALVLAVLCVLLLTVAATGGSSPGVIEDRDRDHDRDRVLENVTIEPHDGPNGAYAHFDGNDELGIDLTASNDALEGDGVPAEATTGIDDVFRLDYTGDERARIWLEHDSASVSFYRSDGSRTAIDEKHDGTTLEPERSLDVGFTVDTRDRETIDPLIEGIKIRVERPDASDGTDISDGEIGASAVSPCPVGPSVAVETPKKTTRVVSVTNAGGCGPETIDLPGMALTDGITLERVVIGPAGEEGSVTIGTNRWPTGDERIEQLRRDADTDDDPVGTITLEGDSVAAFETVEYRLVVDRDLHEEPKPILGDDDDTDPIAVYRYDESGWTDAALERVNETERTLEYAVPVVSETDHVVTLERRGTVSANDDTGDADSDPVREGAGTGDRNPGDGTDDSADVDRSGFGSGHGTVATAVATVSGALTLGIFVGLAAVRLVRTYR